MTEYKCEYCHARKNASQLRWYRDDPICLYCWVKFDQDVKWYSLDKISDVISNPQATCEECGCELVQHESRDICNKPHCARCWHEKVKCWHNAIAGQRG